MPFGAKFIVHALLFFLPGFCSLPCREMYNFPFKNQYLYQRIKLQHRF